MNVFWMCMCLAVLAPPAANAGPVELPIRHLTLYQNGLAMAVREAVIEDSAELCFSVGEESFQAVLATADFFDPSGGSLAGIRWEHQPAASRERASALARTGNLDSYRGILQHFKGALVEAGTASGPVTGRLAGVQQAPDNTTVSPPASLVLYINGRTWRLLPLPEITSVRFSDPALQQEFQHVLAGALENLYTRRHSITVQITGRGKRKVALTHLMIIPAWKTAYRLMQQGGDAILAGYATIYNTTGEDWQDVQVTLVSAAPHQVVLDQLQPVYMNRISLSDPEPEAAAGVEDSSLQDQLHEIEKELLDPTNKTGLSGPGHAVSLMEQASAIDGESVMLKIFEESIPVRPVTWFTPRGQTRDGQFALLMSNLRSTYLEEGLCTIYENGRFKGESLLAGLNPGAQTILAYARDPALTVSLGTDEKTGRLCKAEYEDDEVRLWQEQLAQYQLQLANSAGVAKTVVVSFPRSGPGSNYEGDGQPVFSTTDAFLVEFSVPARELRNFQGKQTGCRLEPETIGRDQLTMETMSLLKEGRLLADELVDLLAESVRLQDDRKLLELLMTRTEKEMVQIETRQGRVRENLKAIKNNREATAARAQYVRQLVQDEEKLDQLGVDLDQSRGRLLDLDERLMAIHRRLAR